MSARNHLNPDQLKLFYTGKELKDSIDFPGDFLPDGGDDTHEDMWKRKEQEARAPYGGNHGSGVYDSLREHGWKGNPLNIVFMTNEGSAHTTFDAVHEKRHISERTFGNHSGARLSHDGHHRIAASAALEDEGKTVFIPVNYAKYSVKDR